MRQDAGWVDLCYASRALVLLGCLAGRRELAWSLIATYETCHNLAQC